MGEVTSLCFGAPKRKQRLPRRSLNRTKAGSNMQKRNGFRP